MANKYYQFFVESPEGEVFMKSLRALIEAEHKKAEDNPDQSLAHTQRACGIRQVVAKISSMSADIKKPGREEQDS